MIILYSLLFLIQLPLMALEKSTTFEFQEQLVKTCDRFNETFDNVLKSAHCKKEEFTFAVKFFNKATKNFKSTICNAPAIINSEFYDCFKYSFKSLTLPENIVDQSLENRINELKKISLQRDWFFEAVAFIYGQKPIISYSINTYTKDTVWTLLNLKDDPINKDLDELKNQVSHLSKSIVHFLDAQEAQFEEQDPTADDATATEETIKHLTGMHNVIKTNVLLHELNKEIPYYPDASLHTINDIINNIDSFLTEYKTDKIIKNDQRPKLKELAEKLKKIYLYELNWQNFHRLATAFSLNNEHIPHDFIETIGELRKHNKETQLINENNIITQWGNTFCNTVGNLCDGTAIKNKFTSVTYSMITNASNLFYKSVEKQAKGALKNSQNVTADATIPKPILHTLMNNGVTAVAENIAKNAHVTVNNQIQIGLKATEKFAQDQRKISEMHALPLECFLKAMTFSFYLHCAKIDELKPVEKLTINQLTCFTRIYQGTETPDKELTITLNEPKNVNPDDTMLLLTSSEKQEELIENNSLALVPFVQEPIIVSDDINQEQSISSFYNSCTGMVTNSGHYALALLKESVTKLSTTANVISEQWTSLHTSLANGQHIIAKIEQLIKDEKDCLIKSPLIEQMPNQELKDLITNNNNIAEIMICILPLIVNDYLTLRQETIGEADTKVDIKTMWGDQDFLKFFTKRLGEHVDTYNNGLEDLKNAAQSISKFRIYISRMEAGDVQLKKFIPIYNLIKEVLHFFAELVNDFLYSFNKGTIVWSNTIKKDIAKSYVTCINMHNQKINAAKELKAWLLSAMQQRQEA